MKTKVFILVFMSYHLIACLEASEKQWGDAPDFTLNTIDGEIFTLSNHTGKPIIIDFMATWCGLCKRQIPVLEAMVEELNEEIMVISIDVDKRETGDDVRNVFGEFVGKWTFLLDDYNENVQEKLSSCIDSKTRYYR